MLQLSVKITRAKCPKSRPCGISDKNKCSDRGYLEATVGGWWRGIVGNAFWMQQKLLYAGPG